MVPGNALPLLPSVPPVDVAWGGLFRNGAYLLVGPAAPRHRLALATLDAPGDGLSLLVSARGAATLSADAAEIGQDLAAAYRAGRVKLLRTPGPATLGALDDRGLARALSDLTAYIQRTQPTRVVVEDFSALLRFASFEAFAEAFSAFTGALALLPTTLLLGLGEPADEQSRRLLHFLQGETTGTIHVAARAGEALELTLLPGPAHPGDDLKMDWDPLAPTLAFTEIPLAAGDPEEGAPPTRRAPGIKEADAMDGTAAPEEDESDPFEHDVQTIMSSGGYRDPVDLVLDPLNLFMAPPHSSDDAEASSGAVRPVVPSGASCLTPRHDPLGVGLEPAPRSLGHFADSRVRGAASGDGFAYPLDSVSATVRAAATPDVLAPEEKADEAFEHEAPRQSQPGLETAFCDALAEAFAQHAEAGGDFRFVVFALRLDPAGPYADLFLLIEEAVDGALVDDSALYASPQDGRLVVLLPEVGEEAADALLTAVRKRLEAAVPARAAEALRALSTLTLPGGAPFASADDLLAYVLGP